ncbi:hypothetical protein IL306_003425, partial [Fusarium sp. DS 682]
MIGSLGCSIDYPKVLAPEVTPRDWSTSPAVTRGPQLSAASDSGRLSVESFICTGSIVQIIAGQDIWEYLNKVTHTFGLRKYMTFNTEVVGAVFDESRGKWRLKIRRNIPQTGKFDPTKEPEGEIFYDECDLLLYATGMLNKFKWPEITGLERFKGRLVHTAHWPEDYQAEQWKQDRVAVIGSGASSVQTVPGMQPYVKHMDVFVRTGVWFVQIANNFGANHEYTDEQKREFKEHPEKLVAHAKDIENQINNMWGVFYTSSERQESTRELSRQRMAEFIKDERLLKGFTPKLELG